MVQRSLTTGPFWHFRLFEPATIPASISDYGKDTGMRNRLTVSGDNEMKLYPRGSRITSAGAALLWVVCLASILLAGLVSVRTVSAQQDEITVEWIYGGGSAEIDTTPWVRWVSDGSALYFNYLSAGSAPMLERLDPETGTRSPAIDVNKLRSELSGKFGGRSMTPFLMPPAILDSEGRQGAYLLGGDIWLLNMDDSTVRRLTSTPSEEISVSFSPDGSLLAFVRDNDLWSLDIKTGEERQLTTDGAENILNGTLTWVYWEEIFGRQDTGYWWAPDSEAIAYLRTDDSMVGEMHYVDFEPALPRVITQRYPKTGSVNPDVRAGIVELDSGRTTWINTVDPYEYIIRVKWLPDAGQVSIQTMNRAQTELNLEFADRYSGKSHHILRETDKGWINIHDDLHFLEDGEHFIWASERNGYFHLYLYASDGTLVRQLTDGEWAVASSTGVFWIRQAVSAIDESNGWIYFTSMEKSPLERHLYRIGFDGEGMERISQRDGTHQITFSPNLQFYFDDHSAMDVPPSLRLHNADGTIAHVLTQPRTNLVEALEMVIPEELTVPASDGFPMPAQLWTPSDFDPGMEYPLILYVYGGPSAPLVADSWLGLYGYYHQILLMEGYLVAIVDNRSATAISKTLENTILGDSPVNSELSDLLDAVRWFKSQSYVDPDRVGIWGWSGGGSFTLAAMTGSSEFKAGIAVAAVSDWAYYDTKWAEAYMKRPQDNPAGYEASSHVSNAHKLEGRLLLVHGTYDDNVHIQNAWAFTDALIAANKTFDMMIYPMRKHGISDRAARIHLFNTMLEFWKKNL